MMDRTRIYSGIITLAVCALIAAWLMLARLTVRVSDREWPPKHTGEITVEEYAEIIDLPQSHAPAADIPSPAPLPEEARAAAEPMPESGHDVTDAGAPAEAPATVSSRQPSPVKTKPKEPARIGPSAEERKRQQQEEEARRRATPNTRTPSATPPARTTPPAQAPARATPARRRPRRRPSTAEAPAPPEAAG